MRVTEVAEGLWRWTLPHPAWRPENGRPDGWEQAVSSTLFEAEAGGVHVLVDPLVPALESDDHARFFRALDRDLEGTDASVVVVVLNRWHSRSAQVLLDRYGTHPGAESWAHEAAAPHLACRVDRTFQDGDRLPGGCLPIELPGLDAGESALFIPALRTLVVADALIGGGGGGLRLAPPAWSADAVLRSERFALGLERLADLDVERVLPSHGEPVLERGRAAIRAALAAHCGLP